MTLMSGLSTIYNNGSQTVPVHQVQVQVLHHVDQVHQVQVHHHVDQVHQVLVLHQVVVHQVQVVQVQVLVDQVHHHLVDHQVQVLGQVHQNHAQVQVVQDQVVVHHQVVDQVLQVHLHQVLPLLHQGQSFGVMQQVIQKMWLNRLLVIGLQMVV